MDIILVACGNVNIDQLKKVYYAFSDPFIIGVDRGTLTAYNAGLPVKMSVGDFDTVKAEESLEAVGLDFEKQVILLNPVKDDTDTEHALRLAIDMLTGDQQGESGRIIMFGCTGSRLDHTFASIRLLKLAAEKNVEAYILDMNNRIRVARGEVNITRDETFPVKYISVLPYGDQARKITEKGFKYEITDVTMDAETSLGISNELTSDNGKIFSEDYLIIMETRD